MLLLENIATMNNGYQEANLNAGHHLNIEELNELHPLWSKSSPEPGDSDYDIRGKIISFSNETQNRDEANNDKREKTDFIERGERPLCKALKLLEAAVYDRPVYKILLGEKDKFIINAIDIIIEDILETLNKGESYRFNNSSSMRVKSSPAVIDKLETAYVKFRYVADLPPYQLPPPIEEKKELLKVLPIQTPENTSLVRQASRSVYCSPPPVNNLEERYLKLLGR